MRLAAELGPDPLGSYSALPDPLAVIAYRGREGTGRKGLGIGMGGRRGEEREGWEGGGREEQLRDGKGRKGSEEGESVVKGKKSSTWILVQGLRVPSYAAA